MVAELSEELSLLLLMTAELSISPAIVPLLAALLLLLLDPVEALVLGDVVDDDGSSVPGSAEGILYTRRGGCSREGSLAKGNSYVQPIRRRCTRSHRLSQSSPGANHARSIH